MHYHLIGIAGAAMASLAGLLRAKGHLVTGSDHGVYPPMSTMLDDLGIEYASSYSADNLRPAPDVIVVGNAISRGNEELETVLEQRLHYTSSASVVKNEFLRGRHVMAVAGTHGKTTTTSILAWLLESSGSLPAFLIGGVSENFGTSFRLTDSDFFVIEADEYDTAYFDKGPKMWHYLPQTAVVTNIEFDHADIYRDESAYRFAFERFVNLIPRTGTLVAGWDSPIVREVSHRSLAPVESFGLGGPLDGSTDQARWQAQGIEYGPDGTRFEVIVDGRSVGRVETSLSGAYNVQNCLAAAAAAASVGVSWLSIQEGLRTFRSVRRRMEILGEVGGVMVIDDFAHHPTSVRGTIEATRQRFQGRSLIAVFEPRSYTAQLKDFQAGYQYALQPADKVILSGLFRPERYDAETGMDPEELVQALRADGVEAEYIPEVASIVQMLVDSVCPGDVVLIMSNGGFGGIHDKLMQRLEARAGGL